MEGELSLKNEAQARERCLIQLSAALYQKVKIETADMNPAGSGGNRPGSGDAAKQVRPRSRQIKRLGLDYILPMLAQSLTVIGTANAAADVLNNFDSKEVQHLFDKLLKADEGGIYYCQQVFDYLAANSKKTYSNKIIETLLDLKLLQRPDMLGSRMATMVFRSIIAVAQNAPCTRKQERLIKQRLEAEIQRCYRKFSVLYWLTTISFSDMLQSYITHHIAMTNERILLLLAAICPYDPVRFDTHTHTRTHTNRSQESVYGKYVVVPAGCVAAKCISLVQVDEYADVVLSSEDEDQVASALELIEGSAPMDLWAKIIPLLQPDMTIYDRVRVGRRFYADLTESIDDALQEYLQSASEIWPAFVLDLCIKNELNDFLDSVPWKEIQSVVTEMYNEKKEGRLTDGSHIMLEVMNRDNQKSRKLLKEIKTNLIKEHRQAEMKEDLKRMASTDSGERAGLRSGAKVNLKGSVSKRLEKKKQSLVDRKQNLQKSMLGMDTMDESLLTSLDQLQSQDFYAETNAEISDLENGAYIQEAAELEKQEKEAKGSGFLCFRRGASQDGLDGVNEKKKELQNRMQKEAEEKILQKKRELEYMVRFHMDFGTVGDEELLEPRPEEARREELLARQKEEADLVVPTVIELDNDIMKDFIDDGKGYGGAEGGQQSFSWKSLFKRQKDVADGFMMVSVYVFLYASGRMNQQD